MRESKPLNWGQSVPFCCGLGIETPFRRSPNCDARTNTVRTTANDLCVEARAESYRTPSGPRADANSEPIKARIHNVRHTDARDLICPI